MLRLSIPGTSIQCSDLKGTCYFRTSDTFRGKCERRYGGESFAEILQEERDSRDRCTSDEEVSTITNDLYSRMK